MITLDFGKYESSTWSRVSQKNEGEVKKLTAKTVSLLSSLFGNKTTDFQEWEESFTEATKGQGNSAYIAALQRTLHWLVKQNVYIYSFGWWWNISENELGELYISLITPTKRTSA